MNAHGIIDPMLPAAVPDPSRQPAMTPSDIPGPDNTAAELRLVRAEMAAIRRQIIREQETREHRHDPPPALPAALPAWRARLAAWLTGQNP